jgi:tetratricopeptide (TPR) repeat protein
MDVASQPTMKPAVAVALLLLLSFATASPQQAPATTPQPAGQAPASGTTQLAPGKDAAQSGPAQAPTPPDYSQQAYVVEHFVESMRFENDGTGSDQTDARIKIIGESGVQALGQLKMGYSALSDKMDIVYVRVHKPDGTVVQAQESAVQDLTFPDAPVYTDYHEKHISVPSLRPGDVLEYRFIRTIISPLTPGQFWTSYNFADKGVVLDEHLEINVPKDRQITLKNKVGYKPAITEEGDRRIYRWTHSRLKDDYDGKKKTKKPKADEIPTVQLTTYKNWQEVGTWYANLERERRIPDSAVKAEADALVKGKPDNMAKVKALYDYVSRNIRYVSLSFGLGRIQPHAASEVLSNGYGDCKDKNTLLAALLDAEGFRSTSVLIGSQRKLDPDVPSPMQFDHVITRVPVDGKDIWLDSTPGVAPFRMLSSNLRGKQALAISPDGKAELVWTPRDYPFEAFDRTALEGTVSDAGKLTAHVSITGRGDTELMLRFAMRRMPSNHWKDIFDYMLQQTKLRGAEITNLTATDPSATDDPIKVDFDVTAYNYFDWSAPESKFPLPLSTVNLPGGDDDDDDDSAKNEPMTLGLVRDGQADVKLTFPAKYKLRSPISVDVKRDYAEYHSVYKYEGNQFTSRRTLKILMQEIPQSRADDYAAFRRVVASDEAQEVSLENTQPGTAATGGSETAADLNAAAMQALNNQRFDLAIDLLQRVVKLDPKYKSAWDNLGRAYLAMGKDDEAAQALQKQIEINPYDEFAYNGLGLVDQHQSKYDEAIKQFQKQIEINPLDQNAHANLGLLYLSQKRFAEAIPELEKAIDIHPKNPLLEISLGQAYIATNQTDKGMAAFEKAIALAPVPVTWNNIAYSLSEQNIQLDRAGKYSDAAINAVETQMRDINLDKLRMQDLATANFLYNAWDTKGWIEFKRGNTATAEAFVHPAFLASGHGDEAEHLGEIYEKQGKRDEAIRFYIFSLISDTPSTDARTRLQALGVKDVDSRMTAARADLLKLRSIPLSQSGKGTAEFFLLISPSKVEQAKFIKGDDELKSFTETLQKADLKMAFPPDTQVQAVRRAILHCGSTSPGPCTLELVPSAEVRSLE